MGLECTYRPRPPVKIGAEVEKYLQYQRDKTLFEATTILRPQFQWTMVKDVTLTLYFEGVGTKSRGELYQWRTGGSLAWRVGPKSWFFVALNDLEWKNNYGSYLVLERIAEVKLRYLFFF